MAKVHFAEPPSPHTLQGQSSLVTRQADVPSAFLLRRPAPAALSAINNYVSENVQLQLTSNGAYPDAFDGFRATFTVDGRRAVHACMGSHDEFISDGHVVLPLGAAVRAHGSR